MKHQGKKDLQLFTTKLTEKIPDLQNAKKYYQSFIKKKNTKSIKQSKIFTQKLKTFENSNNVDIKSFSTEHPKTSHKLPKTLRRSENSFQASSNSSLYCDTKM